LLSLTLLSDARTPSSPSVCFPFRSFHIEREYTVRRDVYRADEQVVKTRPDLGRGSGNTGNARNMRGPRSQRDVVDRSNACVAGGPAVLKAGMRSLAFVLGASLFLAACASSSSTPGAMGS